MTDLSHAQMEIFRVNSYHNTTGERREAVLQEREKKARGQEAIILEFFKNNCMESFTALQVYNILAPLLPIQMKYESSVRRSVCNLAKKDLLIPVGMVDGGRGSEVNKYQYAGKPSTGK